VRVHHVQVSCPPVDDSERTTSPATCGSTPQTRTEPRGGAGADRCDDRAMIDHVSINCDDIDAAKHFYDTVLGVLGHTRVMEHDDFVGYGSDGKPDFWIGRYDDMPAQREVHIAFTAPDAATVRAFHAAALELGAEVLNEPRMWPEYHDGYYATFVRDPDGNNVEAVCHRAAEGD